MKELFWLCFLLTGYAYFGYPLLLGALARLRSNPVRRPPMNLTEPTVSVIIAVRNEEANLPSKLVNVRESDYPQNRLQIVVASDGSTDGTVDILRQAEGVVPVVLSEPGGKARALNAAVEQAQGQVLIFMDVRQQVDSSAIRHLVECLADHSVGAVSGELFLEGELGARSPEALGVYWKLEKLVRRLESQSGSVVGVTGALYAMRRDLFREIPAGTILDDVYVPMQVIRAGKRVIFEPAAIARDRIFKQKGKEFGRKVRTLTGNYQLLRLEPWILTLSNPLLFRFISHKLMRLLVPLLLIGMFIGSGLANSSFYKVVFVLQVLFYGLALAGKFNHSISTLRIVAVANTFVMLNVAAAVAFYNFISRRENIWV